MDLDLEYRNNKIKSAIANSREDLWEILRYADRVYLYGEDKYVGIMGKYIAEHISCDLNLLTDDARVEPNDIVFILTLDDDEFTRVAQSMIDKYHCSLLQLIPPACFFTKVLAEVQGTVLDIDLKKVQLPFLANIEIVDNCNLSCLTCRRDAFMSSAGRMDIDLFRRILDKLQLMGVWKIEMYNYTEPFLHPDIYEFVKEVKKRNLILNLSTNLSLKNIPHLKDCVDLLTPDDLMIVTISGIRKDVYEINHRGGNIDNVINNLHIIAKSSSKKSVRLRLLKFDYNKGELLAAKKLAAELGLSFEWQPAFGNPFGINKDSEKLRAKINNGISLKQHNYLFDDGMKYCRFIHSRNIVLNYLGNVEQCCQTVTRPYDFGSFLEQDISVIQMKREFSALCCDCTERYTGLPSEKIYPVDADKVRVLMNNAMNTLGIIKNLSPVSLYEGIKSNSEYMADVKNYYIDKAINSGSAE